MITGYNTDIRHKDRVFHLQTEDKGIENPTIESLIYAGGKIIASRQYSYAWLLREGYSEKVVQELLDAQHRKMMRDIRGGKYDPEGPPPFGAGIISERSLDEVILEFLRSQAGAEGVELVLREGTSPRAGHLVVLDLAVRGDVRSRPVAGAQVVVHLVCGSRRVTLFEGAADEAGSIRAGLDLPPQAAGAELLIEASGPSGSDRLSLQVPAS